MKETGAIVTVCIREFVELGVGQIQVGDSEVSLVFQVAQISAVENGKTFMNPTVFISIEMVLRQVLQFMSNDMMQDIRRDTVMPCHFDETGANAVRMELLRAYCCGHGISRPRRPCYSYNLR